MGSSYATWNMSARSCSAVSPVLTPGVPRLTPGARSVSAVLIPGVLLAPGNGPGPPRFAAPKVSGQDCSLLTAVAAAPPHGAAASIGGPLEHDEAAEPKARQVLHAHGRLDPHGAA